LKGDPRVAAAQPNYIRRAVRNPNDPAFTQGYQNYLKNIDLPAAWDITIGSSNYKVAVVDTGVDLNTPDLAARIYAGYDFVNNDTLPWDDNGHGTMVAGIASAITNNSLGVAGAAWRGGIIPVKVLDANGNGTDANVADGIKWAADHGAKVINLSLGGPDDSPVLSAAVDYATGKNILVVAAAGNNGNSDPEYPAAYPSVVAVAASDATGNFAWFSSYGWWVDLVAPGINITSTYKATGNHQAYAIGSGTSFAAPLVSGVALLTRFKYPTLSQAQIAAKLKSTARDFGPRGIDPALGWGRVDAHAALGGAKQLPYPVPARDSLEPNGVIDQAKAITTSATATISPEGDTDWYSASVASPGSVMFTATPPPYNPNVLRTLEMDPVLAIYGPDLTLLGEIDQFGAGTPEALTVSASTAGTYYAEVRNYFGSRSPGTYTIAVSTSAEAGPRLGPRIDVGESIWVENTAPGDFATGFGQTSSPTVTFARDLDPASVTTATAYLVNGVFGSLTPITVSYDEATRTVTIDPTPTLTANRAYIVYVVGVNGTHGDVMTELFTFRFTTGTS
jgi:serine protease